MASHFALTASPLRFLIASAVAFLPGRRRQKCVCACARVSPAEAGLGERCGGRLSGLAGARLVLSGSSGERRTRVCQGPGSP
eukprot:269043-Pyramimonas_sp.AAC.1